VALRIFISCFIFLLILIWYPLFSQNIDDNTYTDHRLALVIGNAEYLDAPLKNPVNDANAIAASFKSLNFEVLKYTNLTRSDLRRAIMEFGDRLKAQKSVGVFYYAGHGIQADGRNYLIPIDAKIEREWMIEDECIRADLVLRMMELYENPMNIIVLDACRNNPYSRAFRSLSRGLTQPEGAPSGSLIAFATSPGKTASDGDGENGLYTQEFVKALKKPMLSVEEVFKEVRINVSAISNEEQIPWENSSLMGTFYFNDNDEPEDIQPSEATENLLAELSGGMSIGKVRKLIGSVEIEALISGELFVDDQYLGEVQKFTIVPIHGIQVGTHKFKIVNSPSGKWEESVVIKKNDTTQLLASEPPSFIVIDNPQQSIKSESEDPLSIKSELEDNEMTKLFIERKFRFKSRLYLSSGGKQYVPDGRPGMHSPFSGTFIKSLRTGGGTDSILTKSEIFDLMKKVNPTPRMGNFGSNESGSDFLFSAQEGLNKNKKYALLFATGRYKEWGDLVNPVFDSRTIADELMNYGYEVELIENPSMEDFLLKFREYSIKEYEQGKEGVPGDQLLIYIAGHGFFDKKINEGYIVLKDSKVNDKNYSTYISQSVLRSIVDNIPARHTFLVTDTSIGSLADLK